MQYVEVKTRTFIRPSSNSGVTISALPILTNNTYYERETCLLSHKESFENQL